MESRLFKQENGKFCYFDTSEMDVTHVNMGREEAISVLLRKGHNQNFVINSLSRCDKMSGNDDPAYEKMKRYLSEGELDLFEHRMGLKDSTSPIVIMEQIYIVPVPQPNGKWTLMNKIECKPHAYNISAVAAQDWFLNRWSFLFNEVYLINCFDKFRECTTSDWEHIVYNGSMQTLSESELLNLKEVCNSRA